MSLESDIAAILAGDPTLTAILTGGVHQSGTVGRDGITSRTVPAAFDSDGYLKPAVLVKQRSLVPDYQIEDKIDLELSANQVVEIWVYQESGYVSIDLALSRIRQLLMPYQPSYGFEPELVLEFSRERDDAALAGASMGRQDWSVPLIVD